MSGMFRSLAVRNYRIWFAAALLSNVGTWMQRTAQDWIVLTELSHEDAVAVGVVSALQLGPSLLLAPLSGLAADRFDRRRFLMITQSATGVLGLCLAVITLAGVIELWHVYVLALLLGVVSSFDVTARQAFVSELVGPQYLGNAVALNSASFTTARLVGPAIAGLLTAVIGAGWVFLLDAATFAATLAALSLIRSSALFADPRAEPGPGQLLKGFRYIAARPDIALILVIAAIIGTFGFNFGIFTVTMARVEFGRGATEFGMLAAAMAVGSIVGALVAARVERPRQSVVVLSAGGFGLACLAAAATPGYISFALALVLIGLSSQMLMTTANATIQLSSDPLMRGRVMSIYFAVFVGGTAFGAPLMGWLANTAGPRWALIAGGASGLIAFAIAAGWLLASRRVRVRRRGRWPVVYLTSSPADCAG